MTDNDHNAFVSMHEGIECENPYDEPCLGWADWEDEENPENWWV